MSVPIDASLSTPAVRSTSPSKREYVAVAMVVLIVYSVFITSTFRSTLLFAQLLHCVQAERQGGHGKRQKEQEEQEEQEGEGGR